MFCSLAMDVGNSLSVTYGEWWKLSWQAFDPFKKIMSIRKIILLAVKVRKVNRSHGWCAKLFSGQIFKVTTFFFQIKWGWGCLPIGSLRKVQDTADLFPYKFVLQLPTISDMTKRERNFQLKVEELLSDISNPEYRQTVVEVSFFIFILQLRDIR